MSRQVETTLTEAAAKNLSVSATLEWLADMELEARKQRAIDRRFKCSRLQAQPSIDAFHFHHHKSRQQAKPRLLRLLDLSFLAKGTNLVLIGNPGVGNTFLAKLIAWRRLSTARCHRRALCGHVAAIRLHKRSFAPIGPGTVPVETVKVIRPNHVSGLSRINVLQCRKRCTGQQKGSPFCPFRGTIRKSGSLSLCRGGRDVRHHHHQKQKQ